MREIKKYGSTHDWIKRYFGKPNFCEHCGSKTAKKFEWANISGEYKRERTDWLRLCTSCHHKYDNSRKTMWEVIRAKRGKPCKECGKITSSKHQLCPADAKTMYNKRRSIHA